MNVRIAQLLSFNAGTWYDNELEMTEYTVKLWMITNTYSDQEQNIAICRVKHFVFDQLENTIFINQSEEDKARYFKDHNAKNASETEFQSELKKAYTDCEVIAKSATELNDISTPKRGELGKVVSCLEQHQHSYAQKYCSTNTATEKARKCRYAHAGKHKLGGCEHGSKSHAEQLDDGAAREKQSPKHHRELPSEFVDDQRRNSEEDRNEDRHSATIAWSKTMCVNRREYAKYCGGLRPSPAECWRLALTLQKAWFYFRREHRLYELPSKTKTLSLKSTVEVLVPRSACPFSAHFRDILSLVSDNRVVARTWQLTSMSNRTVRG